MLARLRKRKAGLWVLDPNSRLCRIGKSFSARTMKTRTRFTLTRIKSWARKTVKIWNYWT